MASDVAPSPTLFEILLGSSLHVREIVFCECSVLELARLSCASSAARNMSLTEMGRRSLDVSVRMEQEERDVGDFWDEEEEEIMLEKMSDAEHVEVRHGGWSLHHEEAAILALKAPNINVREWISIKEHDVRAIIGQWQAGHRNIVTFLAKTKTVPLLNDADNTDKGFAERIKNLIANSSEIPYPSDDVIPTSVRLQMDKMEKYYGNTDKEPRAFLVGRDRDDSCLVVPAKIATTDYFAVGIFQKL